MEKKKIKRFFNLNLNACISRFEDSGIGPMLSPFINKEKINSFCNEFNIQSKVYKSSLPLRVNLCLFIDNSFLFYIKGVGFSTLLKITLNVNSFNQKSINGGISIVNFFFICILKNNLFLNNKKIYHRSFFLSMLNSLNSLKNLIIINEL